MPIACHGSWGKIQQYGGFSERTFQKLRISGQKFEKKRIPRKRGTRRTQGTPRAKEGRFGV
jgi:hypothetical protein